MDSHRQIYWRFGFILRRQFLPQADGIELVKRVEKNLAKSRPETSAHPVTHCRCGAVVGLSLQHLTQYLSGNCGSEIAQVVLYRVRNASRLVREVNCSAPSVRLESCQRLDKP